MEVIARRKINYGLIAGLIIFAYFFIWVTIITVLLFIVAFDGWTHSDLGIIAGFFIPFMLWGLLNTFKSFAIRVNRLVAFLKLPKNIIVLDGDILVINGKEKKPIYGLTAAEYKKRKLILDFTSGRTILNFVANPNRACERLLELMKEAKEQENG